MSENQQTLREVQQIGEDTQERLVTMQQLPLLALHKLGMVGHSDARAGFHFVRSCPHFAQVLVTLEGCGIVRVKESWQELKPGMAYLMPTRAFSAYYARGGEIWSVIWVHINADTLSFPSPDAQILHRDTRALQYSVEGLLYEAHGLAEPEPLADWVRLVACEVRRLVSGTPGNAMRLAPLWSDVQTNLTYPWTCEELAARLNLSGERLRKLCQETVGTSPMAHVTQLRMRHAAALLASGGYSVTEVSCRVGYDNTLAFSTAFKRVMGTTPSSCLPRHR
jgi:AraC-like DNA-binding protein